MISIKITKLEPQKKNKNRYSLYIDDSFSFGLSIDLIVEYRLKENMSVDKNFIENVLKAEEQNKANNYALNLLSFRQRSEKELLDKMKTKGYEEENIRITLEMLKSYGYINDELFAKSYIEDQINFKNSGRNKIKQELYLKGLDKELINKVVEECCIEEDEYDRALQEAKKKSKLLKGEDKLKDNQKLYAYLIRKGYTYSIVSSVIKELSNMNIEEIEE